MECHCNVANERMVLFPFNMRDRTRPGSSTSPVRHKGRGAVSNPDGRYQRHTREALDDGWFAEESLPPLVTEVYEDTAHSVLSANRSPDLPFDQSVNAYRGCEHGCIYCYARPTHAYLGLSPGLDFETRLYAKSAAAELLRKELGRPGYRCTPIAMGTNTDPYQPIERERKLTRALLAVLRDCRHPVTITTKSQLIERDLDLLSELAERRLAQVQISLTTFDRGLARLLEPRATAPQRRIQTIRRLCQAGIPVTVLIAPVIPFLTDAELETLLAEAAAAGARNAGYQMLRLPLEVEGLFSEWLDAHFPLKKNHVLNRLREVHGGQIYDARFGVRHSGSGVYAELIRQRFRLALKRLHLNIDPPLSLDTTQFVPPRPPSPQLELF